MLTADVLCAELTDRCLGGRAFTMVKELGRYRTQAVLTESGWQETVLDRNAHVQISYAAAEVRKVAEKFPELTVTYPQQILSQQQPVGNDSLRFLLRRTNAVISVSEAFARLRGGWDFKDMLLDTWQTQTDALILAVCKYLCKFEIKTARMFSEPNVATTVQLRVCSEEISTGIWAVPLSACDLYPLQWDSEICGMALLLADALRLRLQEECGDALRIFVRRDESAQICTLILNYLQQE